MCVNRGWQVMIAPCLPRFGSVRFRWAFVAGCGVRILARLSRSWTLYQLRRSTSRSTRRLYEYTSDPPPGSRHPRDPRLVGAPLGRRLHRDALGPARALGVPPRGLLGAGPRMGDGALGRG